MLSRGMLFEKTRACIATLTKGGNEYLTRIYVNV